MFLAENHIDLIDIEAEKVGYRFQISSFSRGHVPVRPSGLREIS
ncbi:MULTISPECIES: hypothetical protein [unclassified Amycolatopsis]|nr:MULTISPECIES: hypothetical protein [unclassified Amycolatopsis]